MNFEELKAYYKSQGFGDEEAAIKAKYDLKLSQEEYNRYQHPTRYNIGSALKAGADGAGMGATFVNPTIGGLYFLGTGAHLIANGQTAEGVTRAAMAALPGVHLAVSRVSPTLGNWFGAGVFGAFGGTAINNMVENGVNGYNVVQLGLSLLPLTSQVKLPRTTLEVKPQVFYDEKGLPIYGNDKMLEVYPNKPILRKYELLTFPGYMLKSLMRGNPLEGLLSKDGTISINSIIAHAKKGNAMELEIINNVLKLYLGLKLIDYNTFRKAVLDNLILYTRKPLTRFANYGMERLGFSDKDILDTDLATFTFEYPKIPIGSGKHYDEATLGHTRTYTDPTEPDVLHVMESLSDWALNKFNDIYAVHPSNENTNIKVLGLDSWDPDLGKFTEPLEFEYVPLGTGESRYLFNNNFTVHNAYEAANKNGEIRNIPASTEPLIVLDYLKQNYLQRQLQENLRYAAELGLKKMRYPTSETAAKIEGYTKTPSLSTIKLAQEKIQLALEDFENGIISYDEYGRTVDHWNSVLRSALDGEYSPKYQTILKKYAEFPKMYEKLYGKGTTRVVTDSKGNTWYEVDVPLDFLLREILYKLGGKLKMFYNI